MTQVRNTSRCGGDKSLAGQVRWWGEGQVPASSSSSLNWLNMEATDGFIFFGHHLKVRWDGDVLMLELKA